MVHRKRRSARVKQVKNGIIFSYAYLSNQVTVSYNNCVHVGCICMYRECKSLKKLCCHSIRTTIRSFTSSNLNNYFNESFHWKRQLIVLLVQMSLKRQKRYCSSWIRRTNKNFFTISIDSYTINICFLILIIFYFH